MKKNEIKLNKNHVYSLEDLTSEEKKELGNKIFRPENIDNVFKFSYIRYDKELKIWLATECITPTANAKELFYTLENIQVDCRGLSEEQIKGMADVFMKNGYINSIGLNVCDTYFLLRQRWGKEDRNFGVLGDHEDDRFITITYEKFMELFSEPQHEVKEKPKHYSKGIDTFARMEANCTKEECLAFAKGNIDKYNWREKGQDLEDYKKIVSYANWAIKLLKDEK